MILREGTDTAEWTPEGVYLDRMALVLDTWATRDDIEGRPMVDECWIVHATFAEFIGRRVLYSHSVDGRPHYWSRRYRNLAEAQSAAAEVLGATLDEMVRT